MTPDERVRPAFPACFVQHRRCWAAPECISQASLHARIVPETWFQCAGGRPKRALPTASARPHDRKIGRQVRHSAEEAARGWESPATSRRGNGRGFGRAQVRAVLLSVGCQAGAICAQMPFQGRGEALVRFLREIVTIDTGKAKKKYDRKRVTEVQQGMERGYCHRVRLDRGRGRRRRV